MKDIESRIDIEWLMEAFYKRALSDKLIGHYFTEVVVLDMSKHIPRIVDFWETILFDKSLYKGNAMQIHEHLHHLSPFRDEHFSRWLSLFMQTTDELFAGDKAELIKQRATSIATVMRIKTVHAGKGPKLNSIL